MAKRQCDICGNEVGIMSQNKLKDGIVCYDCMSKLGKEFQYFYESFTVEEIEQAVTGKKILKAPMAFQCDKGTFIINPNSKVMYMQLPLMQRTDEISLNTIVGYSYIEDEKQYGVGHALGGAIVGGLLFNGVGAVVGAVAGANPKRKIKRIGVDITYDLNGECQLFHAVLYKGKPIKANGISYRTYADKAKILMGQLDILLEKNKTVESYQKTQNNVMSVAFSMADEIRKFKELLDDNIITEEEFQAKKMELLNNKVFFDGCEKTSVDEEQISTPKTTNKHDETVSELREYILNTFYPEDKVGAIQHYRIRTGLGLVEAKKYIDTLFEEQPKIS